ncbi:MAG: hypothetical protein E7006_03840 [Alphaproteobacteria bacterium]|nr:hypothetical protein [Alphaproteobacteria bacterium]
MTNTTVPHCDGCERHCEFDAFTRTRDKSIYPVIGKKIIQDYTSSDQSHQYISAGQLRSYEAAIKLARKIALSCKHYKTK